MTKLRVLSPLLPMLLIAGVLGGCAVAPQPAPPVASEKVQVAVEKKGQPKIDWAKEFGLNEKAPQVAEPAEKIVEPPRFKSLSPLDTERVSLSFYQEDSEQVMQVLAHVAALNLVMTDNLGGRTITAEYLDMSVRDILDSMCRTLDVAWSEENGTIYIERYTEKIFNLDFLGVVRKSNFSVGGDVLGGSSGSGGSSGNSDANSPLSGNFQIEGGVTDSVSDIYTNLEETVGKIVTEDGTYMLNRQTGTISIKTAPKAMARVEKFITVLREKYQRQVLIEAKIIEVSLDEKHEMGIDWRTVGGVISNTPINPTGAVVNIGRSVTQDDSFYTLNIASKYSDISGVFRALEEYGTLSVLSNPRLKAMNGQSAMISVGESVSYLRSFEQTTDGTGDNQTRESSTEIGSVFDGVLLGVTPVIEDNKVIALHIVPIKSDLVELDTVEFGSDGDSYQITLPRVNLRELSTVTRVSSGDIVLLGGLIMEFNDNGKTGLPGLVNAPMFSWLFGVNTVEKRKVELVVALQVHVVDAETKI